MENRDENRIVGGKQAFDEKDSALQTIASETKRLAYFNLSPKMLTSKESIISRYHAKLKTRKQYIARLRKDLRAACSVVKTLELRKTREVNILKGLLSYARNECVDLLQRYNGAINKSLSLHKQNQIIYQNLENLNSVIQLEYEKLQEISSVAKADYEPSTLGKLKKVIECCEQFYEEYCNESETSDKVQQSNRALKQQLQNLKNQNTRLKFENDHLRSLKSEIKSGPMEVNETDITQVCFKTEALFDRSIMTNKSGDSPQNKELDLTTHMRIVKRVLSDQNNLLKDLDKITELSSI